MKQMAKRTVIVFPISRLLAATSILVVSGMLSAQLSASERSAKKLIEYGWDVPYPDQVLALRQPQEKYLSTYLTPQERLRWFEHNVYYALTTSDEYVWCYSERMNWWQDKVPDGAEAAIRSAREKIAKGEQLGFDIADFIAAGQKKMNQAAEANKPTQEE